MARLYQHTEIKIEDRLYDLPKDQEENYKRSIGIDSPVLGFRKFNIDVRNKTLGAVHKSHIWEPGLNYSSCDYSDNHLSPNTGKYCHCGFNAFFSLEEAEYYCSYRDNIVAAVAGAGNTAIHEIGFRSSEAQILALFIDENNSFYLKEIQEVAKKYRVPVFANKKKFKKYARQLVPGSRETSIVFPETREAIDTVYFTKQTDEEALVLSLGIVFFMAIIILLLTIIF